MRKLRVVFMGTPEFAVATLDAICNSEHAVVGVVTAPDRPAGRGQQLRKSAVKHYAEDKNIPLLQPKNLKDPEFVQALASWEADVQVVVAFRMLPEVVWKLPPHGTFNLHASLLPQYRGAAPINWAIINGETQTGVTTFFIDDKIDTGALIMQDVLDIEASETAGELHDRLMLTGSALVVKTLDAIANGSVMAIEQPRETDLKKAPKIHRHTCELDWEQSGIEIFNKIRGLSPYPGAWSTLFTVMQKPLQLKVFRANFESGEAKHKIGSLLLEGDRLGVQVLDGVIWLLEIQAESKKRMHAKDWLRGVNLQKGAYFAKRP